MINWYLANVTRRYQSKKIHAESTQFYFGNDVKACPWNGQTNFKNILKSGVLFAKKIVLFANLETTFRFSVNMEYVWHGLNINFEYLYVYYTILKTNIWSNKDVLHFTCGGYKRYVNKV